ncbi:MAG: TRAP transporter large permease [Deltaproteobacteria bacterium]|nr:TRAP transporter large permease [Deltaproteobacteria bacterium]
MSPEMTGIIGILIMFLLLALRMYIGIAMSIVGFLGMWYLIGLHSAMGILGITPLAEGSSYTLSVIPLFVLMGQFAFVSGISTDIYKTVYTWMGHLKGGLAMATILACAGFAAICGSSLATGATMGMTAIPEMKKYQYDNRLSTGCVAAGGTLGILIPPSIGFIIYGLLTEVSIGKLFMAGFIPGILLALLFIATVFILCSINPKMGPRGQNTSFGMKMKSLSGTWGMLLLFIIVMGGIYMGVFTPNEAAGVGAFGALLISVLKRKMTWKKLVECLMDSGRTTAMIFLIIIGANIFSTFLGLARLPMGLADFVAGLALPEIVILYAIIIVFILLGCVMDCYAIMILTVPIIFPVIEAMQFDPIWFGVLMVIVLEMGLITPPVGLNVFVLKSAAPDVPITTIFRGIWPFLISAVVAIALLTLFPQIALFLPSYM